MKPVIIITIPFVLLIFMVIFSSEMILNADAQTQKNHSHTISASETVFSQKIPLIGTLSVVMDYSIDFEIQEPSFIEAGKTGKVSLSPRSGVLTTIFFLNGEIIDSVRRDLPLGSTTTMSIPGAFGVGEIFGRPTLVTGLGVIGPSSPSDYVRFDSMSTKDFAVRIDNNIGNYNSVKVFFPMRLDLTIGGNLNLILTNIPITATTIPIEINSRIQEDIPLRKYYDTTTRLEIKDGSKAGVIRVSPSVTSSSGQSVSSSNISIYVDGESKRKVSTNSWSGEIYTGSGKHNIEAKFPETKSSSNNAIIYKSSSIMKSFSVKSPPKSTSTQSSSGIGLTCGSGTHEENGKCVADGMFGGCLIATATYGTELAPEVQKLRELRDNSLLQTKSGTSFMESFNDFYYSFSPYIADYERENPIFKEMVKVAITPMISSLSILNYVDMDSEAEVLGYGISLILLNVGMYFGIPASVIIGIRKRF